MAYKPIPEEVKEEVRRLKLKEKKNDKEIQGAIQSKFGRYISNNSIWRITTSKKTKKEKPAKRKYTRKASTIKTPDIGLEDDPGALVKDIHKSIGELHDVYVSILKSIRLDLLKKTAELRKVKAEQEG